VPVNCHVDNVSPSPRSTVILVLLWVLPLQPGMSSAIWPESVLVQGPSIMLPQKVLRGASGTAVSEPTLRSGMSSAVWPESVNSVLVQGPSIIFPQKKSFDAPPGLREYWDSPWATYSRGRSRWRNQFLFEYLQNRGIVRTKKQIASHIQVLRNMWKGEPGILRPWSAVALFISAP
jgi:hypothetical protein